MWDSNETLYGTGDDKKLRMVLFILGMALAFALFLLIAVQSFNQRIAEGNTRADQAIARSQESLADWRR